MTILTHSTSVFLFLRDTNLHPFCRRTQTGLINKDALETTANGKFSVTSWSFSLRGMLEAQHKGLQGKNKIIAAITILI